MIGRTKSMEQGVLWFHAPINNAAPRGAVRWTFRGIPCASLATVRMGNACGVDILGFNATNLDHSECPRKRNERNGEERKRPCEFALIEPTWQRLDGAGISRWVPCLKGKKDCGHYRLHRMLCMYTRCVCRHVGDAPPLGWIRCHRCARCAYRRQRVWGTTWTCRALSSALALRPAAEHRNAAAWSR